MRKTLEDLSVQLSKVTEDYEESFYGWEDSEIFSRMLSDVFYIVRLSYENGYSVKDVIQAQEKYESSLRREKEKGLKMNRFDTEEHGEQFRDEVMEQLKNYINEMMK